MTRRGAALVVAGALALKLALLAVLVSRRPDAFLTVDSGTYLGPARALLQLGSFAPGVDRPGEPEVVRTPGYPLVVAASFTLFGDRNWPLSALGACASALTALVVLFGMSPPVSPRAAAWAAVLLSADLGSFFHALDVLSETVFTLLLVVALAAFLRAAASGGWRAAAAAGIALAASTLVRPIAIYLGPLALAGLAWALVVRRAARSRILAALAAFALPLLLIVGGWTARNRCVAGFTGLAPVAGHQLLHRRAAAVVAAAEGIPLSEAQERLGIREAFYRFRGPGSERELFGTRSYAEVFPATSGLSLPALDRIWSREALGIFEKHPAGTARMLAEGAAAFLLAPPPLLLLPRYGLFEPSPALTALWADQEFGRLAVRLAREHPAVFAAAGASMLAIGLLWAAAAAGLGLASRAASPVAAAAFAGTVLYFVTVSSGTDAADDRYRVPAMPAACLLAGIGLEGALGRTRVPRP